MADKARGHDSHGVILREEPSQFVHEFREVLQASATRFRGVVRHTELVIRVQEEKKRVERDDFQLMILAFVDC